MFINYSSEVIDNMPMLVSAALSSTSSDDNNNSSNQVTWTYAHTEIKEN